MKRAGSGDACARRVIGIDEVFDASTASARSTAPTSLKIARLISSRSVAASITSPQPVIGATPSIVSIRASV